MEKTVTMTFLAAIARPRALLASLALPLLLAAGPSAAADELKVVATIKPIHALVAQVMDGVGTPTLLVQGAASPHNYALKPSDAKTLNNADVFFRVSENVEPFTRRIVAALPSSVRTVTLADAPGVETLDVRTGETFETHGRGEAHDHHDGDHDHGHHDHGEGAHSHAAGARDGHVWLDPRNAGKMIAEIARALSEASPADAEKFQANAARAQSALQALESDLARDLKPLQNKPYVVFHDAYQYFERRFGLAAVGSITVSPDAQPSARRLTEIRRKLSALSVDCVFSEPQFQPKLVAAVTEGSNARSGTLDPEGALVEPGPDAYAALLRNLALGLKTCLTQGS
jgi:zinc transport system substrate-binding protein